MALPDWSNREGSQASGRGRWLKALITGAAVLTLAACVAPGEGTRLEPASGGDEIGPNGIRRGPRPDVSTIGPEGPAAYGPPRAPGGIGMGPVRIALLVPRSGGESAVGRALADAAELALFHSGRQDVTLIIKDTGAMSAASAAQSAINEGAEIILGPVFSHEVGSVRSVAAPLGVPVVAFSSDTGAAGGGAYLLSFPLEEEVRAIVNYAAARGLGLYATMAPGDAYSRRAVAAFKRDVAATGGQVVKDVTYAGTDYNYVMQLNGEDFDAIFMPGRGNDLRGVAGLLRFGPPPPPAPKPLTEEEIAAGKTPPPPPPPPPVRAQLPEFILLGTGQWDDPANAKSAGLARGAFAAPDPSGRERFRSRFNAEFNYRPPAVASVAYDAVSLAITLSDAPVGQRFTREALTDPNGFDGVDGIFRFLSNGTIQRGLAVVEATGSGFSILRSAPRTFQSIGY